VRHRGRVGEIALGFPGTEAGVVPGKMELLFSAISGQRVHVGPRGEGSQQRIGFGTEAGNFRSGIGSLLRSSSGTEATRIDGDTDAVSGALR
jgi:hypothetical protein